MVTHFRCKRHYAALTTLAFLLVGLFSSSSPADAIPVSVLTEYAWERDASFTVSTEALFSTDTITGSGTELVPLDAFHMVFSHRGYLQSAKIVPSLAPFPEGTLVARFVDGLFRHFQSISHGGAGTIAVTPASNWLGESILLGRNVLIDRPCCAGFSRYRVTTRTGPTPIGASNPIPEPTTLLLLGIGLVGIGLRRWRA